MKISCYFPFKKLRNPYLSAVCEYEKRLQRYCKAKFLPLTSRKDDGSLVYYICSGNSGSDSLSSEYFALFLQEKALQGLSHIHFILTEDSQTTEPSISISDAMLPAPIMTVMLSEQIYRAFRIIHNHTYHK